MVNKTMFALGSQRSAIRELFEYGKKRAAEVGAENVFDYSLGNPTVPAPACVEEAITAQLHSGENIHGYTSAQGDARARSAVAQYLQRTHGTPVKADELYMTCGAAASLTLTLHALCCSAQDEFVVIAPFFPEYRVFIEAAGARCVTVPADAPHFQIDLAALESSITPHTRAVIVNSPNNPSGAVYSPDTLQKLTDILRAKQVEYGTDIYIIADEPYREISYGATVAWIPALYENTVVCYSYSKSLSLPGERIGWVLVPAAAADSAALYAAVAGAGRALGYVCAPSLFQQVVAACIGSTGDINIYKENRDLLVRELTAMGYTMAKPDGAFYLFIQALEPDATAFCERAKEHDLLLVPSDSFGCTGWARVSYCVQPDMIRRSLPAFRQLAESYR